MVAAEGWNAAHGVSGAVTVHCDGISMIAGPPARARICDANVAVDAGRAEASAQSVATMVAEVNMLVNERL